MEKTANVTGWPAIAFILLVFLGLADVVERLIEVVL